MQQSKISIEAIPSYLKFFNSKSFNIDSIDEVLEWCKFNASHILNDIQNDGAVLLRNFPITTYADFSKILDVIGINRMKYVGGNNPRQTVYDDRMYFSTSYPPSWNITLHGEMSHLYSAPKMLGFFCRQPPSSGGETILASTSEILQNMPAHIIHPMKEKGITYIQRMRDENKGFGFGRTWQDVFEMKNKKDIESFCKSHKIDFEWEDDTFIAYFNRTATIQHPDKNYEIWFNQAEQWHNSNINKSVHETIKNKLNGKFPHHARYTSGEEFNTDHLNEIRSIYQSLSFPLQWQQNDVLLINNFTLAHGRNVFQGERELIFIMGNY